MAKKSKKKGNTIKVDFDQVKSYTLLPEGAYQAKVLAAAEGESSKGNPIVKFDLEVSEGPHKGAKLWVDAAMFKLKEFLIAQDQDVSGTQEIDLDELVDTEVGVTVAHDTYEGKTRAKVGDFIPLDQVSGESDDEEEEEDKPKAKKAASKKEEVDVSEMDEDELQETIDSLSLDVDLDDYSSIKKKRAAVEKAMEDDSDEEDDAEETYTKEQIEEMKMKELSTLNDDLGLEIEDIEDMKPKVARKEVIKALKEKKLLKA